jgi:uncharacterized membrane protein YhaH (DUF805 family)
MAFAGNNAGRVNQSRYWTMFGVIMIAIIMLVAGGVVAVAQRSYLFGFLMIAAVLPLGIYWRVIMMRRCRDIGWPAFLPWLFFGLQMAASFNLQASTLLHSSHGATVAAGGSGFVLASVLALGDFVFSVVIGCVATKQTVDYADVFGDGPGTLQRTGLRGAEARPGGPDRFDEAIARALEARRQREQAAGVTQAAAPTPAPPARPSFGRRVA